MRFLYMICFLLFLAAAVCGLITLIRRIFKKNIRIIGKAALYSLIGSVLSLMAVIGLADFSGTVLLFALLSFAAAIVLLIIGLIKKRRPTGGKKLLRSAYIGFGAAVLLVIAYSVTVMNDFPGSDAKSEDYEISIQIDYDFEVVDGTEPVEIQTSRGFEKDVSKYSAYRNVFDVCDLRYLFKNTNPTAEDCIKAINANSDMDAEYKTFFIDFVNRIDTLYPDANLTVLRENLKTLKVVELSKYDYITKSWSIDSYGCYFKNENTIYIPEGTEYIEGEWGFQVLIHEFCHAARSYWREDDKLRCRAQFCSDSDNTMVEESMNSVFSCSLLNYYEWDIAYQIPSNYMRIMLECMDNYELSDYFNHSEQYFFSKLDEYTGYTNYANVIWKLITLQRSDWEEEDMDIPASEYEPIYEYLCDMYYGKYITPEMSEEEANAVAAELVEKAFFDAPEGYKINPDFFYEYLTVFRAAQSADQAA